MNYAEALAYLDEHASYERTGRVDEPSLRERVRAYRAALAARWPNAEVVFASKAFPCTAVYRLMAEEGAHVDVASAGELKVALDTGVRPEHISFAGPGKRDTELSQAIAAGVVLNVESERELEAAARTAVAGSNPPASDATAHAAATSTRPERPAER